MKIVVIGAGFGGLAAAARLCTTGHEVTLVEKRAQLGGRAGRLEIDGYRFDTGPTIVTAPSLLEDLWATAGRCFADDVSLVPLSPSYRIHFPGRPAFDYGGSTDSVRESLLRFDPRGPEQFERFIAATRPIFDRGFRDLAGKPFLNISDFIRVVPDLLRLGALSSVYDYASHFFADEALRTVFSFHPLFIGGNPFRASAIYAMVPYLEHEEGVSFVSGGMHALVEAMARLVSAQGGVIRLDSEAAGIETSGGKVSGVRLRDGERLAADVVVANSDVAHTYLDLVPPAHRGRARAFRMEHYRYSMSCFLLYLGLNRQYPQLLHHTILMPRDYRGTVEQIFQGNRPPDQLALYLHTPSRTDASFAPPGGESMYVLLPVPNQSAGIDWDKEAVPLRDRIIHYLEHDFGLTSLSASIVVERRFTPDDFASQFNSQLGAAFGIEPTLTQSAYFRPHPRSRDLLGLYFVGAGTHPGAGVPGVLLSAKIAADLIQRDYPQVRPSRAIALRRGTGVGYGS